MSLLQVLSNHFCIVLWASRLKTSAGYRQMVGHLIKEASCSVFTLGQTVKEKKYFTKKGR